MLPTYLKVVDAENNEDLHKMKILNQKLEFLLKLKKSGLVEEPSSTSN